MEHFCSKGHTIPPGGYCELATCRDYSPGLGNVCDYLDAPKPSPSPQMICPKAKECLAQNRINICGHVRQHEKKTDCGITNDEHCPYPTSKCIPYVEPSQTEPNIMIEAMRDEAKMRAKSQPEPMPLIAQTTEQELADGIARHLLAEWLAINANKTRLQANEHWEEAQELQDYLSIIGYRNIANSPQETIEAHDQQVRKAAIAEFAKEICTKLPQCSGYVCKASIRSMAEKE